MTSLFVHLCFEHGWTDWDSQYSSWEELYCATIALDGYSLHLGKIHYIQDGDLCQYMWHRLLWTLAINTPGLVTPPIHFTSGWLLLPSELSHSWVTSSAHPHQLSSITSAHQKGWPDPAVPIISERIHRMWWKLRQWRFLMETRCHSETIRVPPAETVFKTQFGSL